jgi:hypothetical protein
MTRKRKLRLIIIFTGLILIVYGMIIAVDSLDESGLSLVYRLITGIFIIIVAIGLVYLGFKIKVTKK